MFKCGNPERYPSPMPYERNAMNKTERRWAQVLDGYMAVGMVKEYHYERFKLKIGKRCWYTPDFLVVFENRIEIHEVKGFWRDDARVKVKACRDLYPFYRWIAISWNSKGKKWEHEIF